MSKRFKIVADKNMPGIEPLFSDIAEITRIDGRQIDAKSLVNVDALLCRSITTVDKKLLDNSTVKFVGTATIGLDHLNTQWLDSHNIAWSNAAGCNAAAVAQYVLSAAAYWCQKHHRQIQQVTFGIIGAGNVGSELEQCLKLLGINYCLYDPPLENAGDPRGFVDFDTVLACDIVTFHVPLTHQSEYSTYHMVDEGVLNQLSENKQSENQSQGGRLLINASRGAVIDNAALQLHLDSDLAASLDIVLDVFENEPNISATLVENCLLATPHIAGHTLEGKARGSWLIYKAFCHSFNISVSNNESSLYPPSNEIDLDYDPTSNSGSKLDSQGSKSEKTESESEIIARQLMAVYDIESDSIGLKSCSNDLLAEKFDQLRQNAAQMANGVTRRDYSGWNFKGKQILPF